MLTVVDCGLGNIGSVSNMLRRLSIDHHVSSDPSVVDDSEGLILPGVGAFDRGMRALEDLGLRPVLQRAVHQEGVPILGICLGMQMLARRSEEGEMAGLGWVPADVVRIQPGEGGLPVPHMGWNEVRPVRSSSIVDDDSGPQRFYFVHSFHMVCDDPGDVVLAVEYGHTLTAAVQRGNVTGVQFHPEKSHSFGMALLRGWCADALAPVGDR